jgi:chromosome segregation protein
MYLKNLSMLGFKSFADKTSLDFQDGVTAIVGPNGCGKSNVADAIRWVLGEQSAKALRGGAMQDVIFSGTDRRKPLQLAEVSMTLDDVTENQLQAAGLDLAYSEVTITRRVYRDGGSEYYINKTQCRLKDIQQLFMGTGVGRTSYSIMAQGNITQILSTKPDDRRIIFEEAAGITRYKAQKREALRKLEHTEQNLLRLEDLVGEVKRRIGTLQRQAGKARKYKEIMDCLKALDTQLSRHKLDVFESDKSRLERQSAELIAVQGIREEEFAAMEAEVDILRTEQADIDEQLNESQRELASLKSECDQNNERIAFHEQRIIELEEQHQQALNESVEADERLKAARSELERSTQSLSQTQERLESQRVNLQQKNEAMLEVERQVASLQEQVNQFQAKAYSTAQELTQLNNQINRLDLQKQGDVARLEKLHTEKIQLREEVARLEEQILHDTA